MAFTGFTTAAERFLTAIGENNSREWFSAHRDEYEKVLRAPLEELTAEAQERYGPGHVTRPNRDVRFSRDKSTYRRDASMWAGDVASVYLRVTSDGLEVGGGLYSPSRDQLERARSSIDGHPTAGDRLSRIVAKLGPDFAMAGPFLKTAPRGYDRDHPRIELLRLQHFAALTHLPITASPDRIREAWHAVGPLNSWIADEIGAAREER